MTTEANRPSTGDEPRDGPPPTGQVRPVAEPSRDGRRAASKFVERVLHLDAEAARAAIQAWHLAMRSESGAWFAAEQAAAHAVLATGRSAEQETLLDNIADFVRRVWYAGAIGQPPQTPERRVGATEASAQYVATVAMLALLVRDHLPATQFAVLYRPFATLIPADDLERE
jgi:hypothetical protein